MKTIQRLPDVDALRTYNLETRRAISLDYVSSNHNWTISNGTITITGNDYYSSSHYVIEASPSSSAAMVLTLNVNDIFDADDEDEPFVFTCVAYSSSSTFSVNAAFYDSNGSPVSGNTRTIQGGIWGAVRSNVVDLTPPASVSTEYSIVLTITNHNNSNVRISTTNIVNDSAWANNPVIQSMRPYIPQLYETYDSREDDPSYPFFRFVDVLSDAIADTMYLYSEWFRYDTREIAANYPTNTYETKSRLTDYQYVRDENLDWLAQFSGSKIKKQIYDTSGMGVITDQEAFKTWQLYPAGYGRNAGTQASLREAIQFVLTGDKTVIISQRYNNDPWAIKVTTAAEQTPGNLDIRDSVRVATTASVNISTGLENGDTIDGVTLITGDRVLVKDQAPADEYQNGVYIVAASGAASRATDFDSVGPAEIATGALFVVTEGNVNGGNNFQLTTTGAITLGTTPLIFDEWAGSPEVLAVAEPARPLGYSLTHKVVEEFTLTLGDPIYGVLGSATL